MRLLNLGCGGRAHPAWVNVDMNAREGVIAHNLLNPLPFGDDEFDAVYHSDVLEHMPKRHAPVFMKECWRVLSPGGILRVAVPDLESVALAYLSCLCDAVETGHDEKYDWIVIELLDQMTRRKSGGEMLNFWHKRPVPAREFVIERIGSEPLNEFKSTTPSEPEIGSPTLGEYDPMLLGKFMLSGEVHQWMYDRYSLGRLMSTCGFREVERKSAYNSRVPDFNTYLLDVEPNGDVRKPDSLFMEGVK